MPKDKEIHEMLDEFIGGSRGEYYWQLEIHEEFSRGSFGGGNFYRIDDARRHMVERMIRMLTEGK